MHFGKHWTAYLHGSKFEIGVDHYALKWLMNSVNTVKLTHWSIKLSGYDFIVKHRPGKMHGNADAMSRAPVAAEAVAFIATALQRSAPSVDSEEDDPITYAEFDISSDATEANDGDALGGMLAMSEGYWCAVEPQEFLLSGSSFEPELPCFFDSFLEGWIFITQVQR